VSGYSLNSRDHSGDRILSRLSDKKKSEKALKAIPERDLEFFEDSRRIKRCHKCILSGGDYFRGDEIYLEEQIKRVLVRLKNYWETKYVLEATFVKKMIKKMVLKIFSMVPIFFKV